MNSLLYKYKKNKEMNRIIMSSSAWFSAVCFGNLLLFQSIFIRCLYFVQTVLKTRWIIICKSITFLSRELDKVGLALATQMIMSIGNLREFLKLAFPVLALRQTESKQIFFEFRKKISFSTSLS